MAETVNTFLIASGTANLTVRQYMRPGSPTVILLHGGPGVPDEMAEVREFLVDYMQVITFDQRGTGNDPCTMCTFSMTDYIQDINNIASYFNLEKFYLFGHSWGGLYAQLYAKEFPSRIAGMFLCSPGSGTGNAWKQAENEVFRYNWRRSTLWEFAGMALNSFLGILGDSNAYRRLFRQIIVNYHKGYNVPPPEPEKLAGINSRAANKTRSAIIIHPPLGYFGKTTFPVMITYGQFDAYGESKNYVLERFPHAQIRIVPDCGHTPWKHNWNAFKPILSDFFLA